MLKYVAKFTKLARFVDNYVATDMTKVRKLVNGLKLSSQGKIGGLLLQDMNFMVKTDMAIEREVADAQSIRDTSVKDKRRESQPSSTNSRKKKRTYAPQGFQGQGRDYQGQGQGQSTQYGRHFRATS